MNPVLDRFISKRFAITAVGMLTLANAGRYGLAAAVTITYTIVQGVIDTVGVYMAPRLPDPAAYLDEPKPKRPRKS